MSTSVDIRGMTAKKLDSYFGTMMPKAIRDSQRVAMNKTVALIKTATYRDVATAENIRPMSIIKQRVRAFNANGKRLSAGVYFDWIGIPVEILAGKSGPRWRRRSKGVTVKGRFFEGAFTGTPRAGRLANKRVRVYKRVASTGSNKDDLRGQYVYLVAQAGKPITIGNRITNERLEELFIQQMNWRIDKAKA